MNTLTGDITRCIVFFNGIYDLLCFASIMWFHSIPGFSTFHVGVLRDEEDRRHPLVRRLLAYWILMYGAVRTLAGGVDHGCYVVDIIASVSYFIEVFGFEYELCCEGTVIHSKVTSITLMSLPIATALLVIRPMEGGV